MDLQMELEEFIDNPDAVTGTTVILQGGQPRFVIQPYPLFVASEEATADLYAELSQVQ